MSNKVNEYSDKRTISNADTPQKRKTSKKKKCPSCGSDNVASIVYGYPSSEWDWEKDVDSGKVVLGGCCVRNEKWECNKCHSSW